MRIVFTLVAATLAAAGCARTDPDPRFPELSPLPPDHCLRGEVVAIVDGKSHTMRPFSDSIYDVRGPIVNERVRLLTDGVSVVEPHGPVFTGDPESCVYSGAVRVRGYPISITLRRPA